MHPIERLRHVARIGPGDPTLLAREVAAALLTSPSPAELVVACRRLLDRQPATGPLWWVACRALTSAEPERELRDVIRELDRDPTGAFLEIALAGDVTGEAAPEQVIVEGWALGESGVLSDPHGVREAEGAAARGESVWVAGGVGRALPPRVWAAALARVDRLGGRSGAALLDRELVSLVAGPDGLVPFEEALAGADCPLAPEILGPPTRG